MVQISRGGHERNIWVVLKYRGCTQKRYMGDVKNIWVVPKNIGVVAGNSENVGVVTPKVWVAALTHNIGVICAQIAKYMGGTENIWVEY